MAVGKHLFCVVGGAELVVFPDFAGPFDGRARRAHLVIDLEGAPLNYITVGNRLLINTATAFYLVDVAQFDGREPPARLSAVKLTRSRIIASQGQGDRAFNNEKGATASVRVTTDAIYEVLKIDHSWWDEKDDKNTSQAAKKPVDHCE